MNGTPQPDEHRAVTLLRQADEHYQQAMCLLDEVSSMELTDEEVLAVWPMAMRLKANLAKWQATS